MPDTEENKRTQAPVAEPSPPPAPEETPDEPHPESRKKKKAAEIAEMEAENTALKTENAKLTQELADAKDALLRLSAEFDNYKKRTAKERDGIYAETVAATVAKLLPVLDNLERAAGADGDKDALRKGVEMTLRQMTEALGKLNVSEIEVKPGDPLDPNLHNAMMKVEDDALPPESVAEVLLKGYRIGDKIIRYTMVKSAN